MSHIQNTTKHSGGHKCIPPCCPRCTPGSTYDPADPEQMTPLAECTEPWFHPDLQTPAESERNIFKEHLNNSFSAGWIIKPKHMLKRKARKSSSLHCWSRVCALSWKRSLCLLLSRPHAGRYHQPPTKHHRVRLNHVESNKLLILMFNDCIFYIKVSFLL